MGYQPISGVACVDFQPILVQDFLLRLPRIFRGKQSLVKVILETFSHKDALRTAWFFGSFAFLWKTVFDIASNLVELTPGKAGAAAGFAAGLALFFEGRERRAGIAQQVLVRGLQQGWNALKEANHISFPFEQGDAFLFIICSAQIMYSYVRHPQVLPPAFYSFIRDTGPIPEAILRAVRGNLHGQPIGDPLALIEPFKPTPAALSAASSISSTAILPIVDCALMHPHTDSCTTHGRNVFFSVFKKIFPVYGTLTLVPAAAFRTKSFIHRPLHMLKRIRVSTVRSSIFLGVFVSSYQEFVCLIRELTRKGVLKEDWRGWYWVAGVVSSLSIFIEDKGRRTELALYTLPRAVESIYLIFYGKGYMPHLPGFEVSMFAAGMGIILGAYHEAESGGKQSRMSGFVRRLVSAADEFIEHPVLPFASEGEIERTATPIPVDNRGSTETLAVPSPTSAKPSVKIAAAHALELAQKLRSRVAARKDFELIETPAADNLTCFRYMPSNDSIKVDMLNTTLAEKLGGLDKAVFAAGREIEGRRAIGAVVVDFLAGESEMDAFLDEVVGLGRELERSN